MTLTKAIEAARGIDPDIKLVLDCVQEDIDTHRLFGYGNDHTIIQAKRGMDKIKKALAALPEKPMSEEKIIEVLIRTVINEGGKPSTDVIMSWMRMLKFLKAANLLHTEE